LALGIFLASLASQNRQTGKSKSPQSSRAISFSSLPRWNEIWESPDPLRGKKGWEVRDYVNIAVAFGFVLMSILLLIPAISVARESQSRIIALDQLREVHFELHRRTAIAADPQFP
jgi:TRAP-type C4-dicarboxylate transport system permease small subunit